MSVIDSAVSWALSIANNNSHGYDQSGRWGPDYDCSSLVISAFKQAGIPLTCTYTGNMLSDMLAKGFKNVTSSVNLATGSGIQKGDVLLNVASHTAMSIGGGQIVQATGNEFGGITGGQKGDQTGKEIGVFSYFNFPWNYVLRYSETQSSGGSSTPASSQTPSSEIQNGSKYVVKQGDNLTMIALKFYGDPSRYVDIMKANNITNPNLIWIGQELVIPSKDGSASSSTSAVCTVTLPVLKYGDNGMKIRKLQKLLEACGYTITVDGDFNSTTQSIVKAFQAAKGLPSNGIVDGKTYEALMS